MTRWYVSNESGLGLDLSRIGPIPLDLNPRWLGARITNADRRLVHFLLDDISRPSGYAPFFVHPGSLSYNIGEFCLHRIQVTRYVLRSAPLCESPASLPLLFEPLSRAIGRHGAVFLEGVPSDSPLATLLNAPTGPVPDVFHVVPYGPEYQRRLIELPCGARFEDYLQVLGPGSRKDLRRTRERFRARANGVVQVSRYTAPDDADRLAATIAGISRKTYQHRLLGLGLDDNAEQVAWLRAAAGAGWLRAYILQIDDDPVAFVLGYQDCGTFYSHHIGYDTRFSKLQPGIFLHMEVVADLLGNGIYCVDLGPGDSVYKARLSNQSRLERHYYLIPRGWPGTVRAKLLAAVNALSEGLGDWLGRTGLKVRLRRLMRSAHVAGARSRADGC